MKTPLSILLLLGLGGGAFAGETKPFASFLELPWKFVIGGYEDGKWLTSEMAGKRLSAPRTNYRVFTLEGEVGKATGTKAGPEEDVCPDVWVQQLTPEPDLNMKAVGVNTPWDPMPRKVSIKDTTQEAYVKAVRQILVKNGIVKPEVKITQILRVDLDGDGEEEVLLSATSYLDPAEAISPRSGNYSFVAMRRLVGGKVRTQVVAADFYPKADENAAPLTYSVMGVLDLDGDGALEVIVNSTYYEGGGVEVWRLQKDELTRVLQIDCGV